MKAEHFPEQNDVLKAPPGLPEDACYDLPIHRHAGGIVSVWRPTKEDIKRIAMGAPIYLHVEGRTHPPLVLLTESPFIPPEASQERLDEIASGASHCGNCRYWVKPRLEAGDREGTCTRWMKPSVHHYHCQEHKPEMLACGCEKGRLTVTVDPQDRWYIRCTGCGKESDRSNCFHADFAVDRWNQGFLKDGKLEG